MVSPKTRRIVFMILAMTLFVLAFSALSINKPVSQAQGFIVADNLMCTIQVSSDKNEIGKDIILIGLKTQTPKVLFEGGATSPMVKVFESDKTLTIQLVATSSGGVDAIVLDKNTGRS
ncbi:MAG: hypothetical protein ACE5JS_09795 [Nitrospinota bacterium]